MPKEELNYAFKRHFSFNERYLLDGFVRVGVSILTGRSHITRTVCLFHRYFTTW